MTDHPNGLQTIADRHNVSLDAVRHLVRALEAGHGTMAQFDHPELGGFGQWSSGGMTMIGTMFDTGLKARVAALCSDLVHALPPGGFTEAGTTPGAWWPGDLGRPATSGAQNGVRYAYFPETGRLAVETDGRVALYATEGYAITGVSQQQGGSSSLRFSGPGGYVDLADLRRLDGDASDRSAQTQQDIAPRVPVTDEAIPRPEASPPRAPSPANDILATLERLAELQRKGVLTDAEFAAKKAELLARL
ncbi:SHOCT domain-containing protein [Methylobacterium gossipiicola]|uniref:Short C-terminal domain-containing protein n=1 Tax=Methylobacterium gossipiicola TaxID=582675 RepID=A0A1I2QU28_9HYPH|nr:SHOCT domain-containing protein [Methylobacterium gossipiicola]SFG29777.1 Short C-terminal domain-containing protein [Methylobacterium gossipiicola]